MRAILLDTGVIVALLDRSERNHSACVRAVGGAVAPLVTCEAVIAESCYLLRKQAGAAQAILENVKTGVFHIPIQLSNAAASVQRLFRKYRDREMDLADACLIHLAGELETGDILTLDRDFEIYRWDSNKPFRLLLKTQRVR
ncbi:MAG: PIN domain-containing protein [Acidobacteriota bacterium]|nr:PIN domain-containing protein [Acidobacteriota bacterium]